MSYTKRARGLRNITVREMKFRWRFSSQEHDSTLAIYGPDSGCQPLVVTLRRWKDFWLAFPSANTNEPKVIGPKFVSQAIIYGLENSWTPDQTGSSLLVDYEDGKFSTRQTMQPEID